MANFGASQAAHGLAQPLHISQKAIFVSGSPQHE